MMLALLGSAAAQNTTDPAAAKKLRAALSQAEKSYKDTKAKYTKNPKDATAKKKYVDATVHFGTTTMNSPLLSPREKYPKSLRLYREALKVDPKNKEAANNIKLIESIYKQMGRPIPK